MGMYIFGGIIEPSYLLANFLYLFQKYPINENKNKYNTSLIAGIVIGTIIFLFIVGGSIWIMYRKKKYLENPVFRKSNTQSTDYNNVLVENGSNYAPIFTKNDDELASWQISFSEIKLERELGRGAFGVVFKGKWRNQDVAVKKIIGDFNEEQLKEFRKEAILMR
jgi:hypothetical protein